MLEIAEFISPTPSPVWKLALQAGVNLAVGGLPFDSLKPGERLGDLAPLTRMKQTYEDAGFELRVIEARPPLNKAKRGLDGRDEEIDVVCTLLESMGKLGIPVWCYEWMTDFNWVRTNMATPSRGGSVVTSFNAADVPENLTSNPPISEEELWTNLEYFLKRVLPVAERAGVKLSMHPDDPPITPIRGVSRIMRTVDNYQRLVEIARSPMNTITLCQGNFTLMTDDLPSVIRKFGKTISFVHFRDVRGVPTQFEETWHDAGKTDMLACMKAYRDIGFDGVLRPDHVPTVEGDSNDNAGYSAFGRLYAIGYIRGLHEAVYAESQPS
ncbi:mannonate dehydratase [Devosia sp. BK]|jgi:mannonate dehydratase|uniref:mannonate dehydratase n=1 Tax=Devosia sp. BK TaxID=2871706 RepID=UPI00293B0682|nr:mannonate dehydratase [Devosia sp. BK]MDV3252877.1 mannonate dehydratase [Devosia sp. BK]